MGKKCLKCGHQRQSTDISPDYECPKCGAIYEKVELALAASGQALKAEDKQLASDDKASNKASMLKGGFAVWDIDSKYLQKGETIEYTDRPSMLSCMIAYIWFALMMIIILLFLLVLIGSSMDPMRSSVDPIRSSMPLMCLIFVFFASPALYVILKRLSTRYAISNKGLLQRVGVVTTSIKSVPFKHITSLEVKETITGKLFRYANLIIDTSGSGKAIELNWDYLKAAHRVKKLVEKHIGA